jgi:hypothetical protein
MGGPGAPLPGSELPPAPVKPRIRVKAAGSKIPETPAAEAPKPKEAQTPEGLPLVGTQEEYDKLPVGSRFRHPDGFIYRKASESGGPEQKLQGGGAVQPTGGNQITQITQIPTLNPPQTQTGTDTVPAKLTPGEYVVPKEAVDKIGTKTLDELSGKTPEETSPNQLSPLEQALLNPPLPIAPVPGGGEGGGGGKSDKEGSVYEQYGWEGHAANYGPHGNRLGEGYGVGLGVDKQAQSGARFGDWVRITFGDGSSIVRQVNETSERPHGVEFFTNHPGTYNNRGSATVEKISAPT